MAPGGTLSTRPKMILSTTVFFYFQVWRSGFSHGPIQARPYAHWWMGEPISYLGVREASWLTRKRICARIPCNDEWRYLRYSKQGCGPLTVRFCGGIGPKVFMEHVRHDSA